MATSKVVCLNGRYGITCQRSINNRELSGGVRDMAELTPYSQLFNERKDSIISQIENSKPVLEGLLADARNIIDDQHEQIVIMKKIITSIVADHHTLIDIPDTGTSFKSCCWCGGEIEDDNGDHDPRCIVLTCRTLLPTLS